jgi:hypothetical protein
VRKIVDFIWVSIMQMDRRVIKDRRQKPTPLLSKYTLWGKRKEFRREEDKKRGGYVDRYPPGLLFPIVLVVGLNVIDAFFTMLILDHGGWEVNPVIHSVIIILGDHFWIWKFGIVSLSIVILCLHSKFKIVRLLIISIALIYISIMLHQIILILSH